MALQDKCSVHSRASYLNYGLIFQAIALFFPSIQDEMNELQQRAQASVDEVLCLQNKRSALYQTYEDVVSSYKANKDADRLNADFRKLDEDHKTITDQISALKLQIHKFWVDGAEKVSFR